MHNDKHDESLFNFVHPEHAPLPRRVRIFWNSVAVLIFFAPPFMAVTSGLGVVLGLSSLQQICPALAHGFAQEAIGLVKLGAIALASLFLTVDFFERHELARLVRKDIYEMIEEHVMPLFR
ncbi:hypothetical protein [Paraburkholderia terrae]|uniref:EscU/YscU/HrcU family type III secretion system export apparatus switch protein n=1 Tax=Paraburkholderia terrae TaxID=311230 RepID=A0ABM7U1Y9_9BURK|nr:hypothetical protein [Paraburkholderia terrae]BCZ85251.1 hypothetical protein PTKU64_89260 [Paraburkholderia terrae]BDC45548.1 hypothetical protein PTKU15_88450 [Paraburkholderia terrae]